MKKSDYIKHKITAFKVSFAKIVNNEVVFDSIIITDKRVSVNNAQKVLADRGIMAIVISVEKTSIVYAIPKDVFFENAEVIC